MSVKANPRVFGTCSTNISNTYSDFFKKRMCKVENKKVDDSTQLARASSTLLKSAKIPEVGKWHCVKSETKNLTNAEIIRYIRVDKGSGDFGIGYNYPKRDGIHVSYFKCSIDKRACRVKVGRSEDTDGNVHSTVEIRNRKHNDHSVELARKKRVVPPDWKSAKRESVHQDVQNRKSVKEIGISLGYHNNSQHMKTLRNCAYNSQRNTM